MRLTRSGLQGMEVAAGDPFLEGSPDGEQLEDVEPVRLGVRIGGDQQLERLVE